MTALRTGTGKIRQIGYGLLLSALLAVGGLSLGVREAAAANLMYSFKIGNWTGQAYRFSDSGRFSHCVAYTRYNSGITLYFFINTTAVWTMGFSKPDWNVAIGQTFPVRYQIDRGPVYRGTAKGATRTMARVTIPTNVRLFQQFRRGRILNVETPDKKVLGFKLTTTNEMLRRLLACAIRNKRRESPDDNPFRKKGNNPFG